MQKEARKERSKKKPKYITQSITALAIEKGKLSMIA